jgi:NSS family neurotransmitter:Na+ symporter
MAAYHALFMGTTALIVERGIAGGIEAACKVLMPTLMVLVVIPALYSVSEGDLGAALRFLFRIDLSSFSASVALEALGWLLLHRGRLYNHGDLCSLRAGGH